MPPFFFNQKLCLTVMTLLFISLPSAIYVIYILIVYILFVTTAPFTSIVESSMCVGATH
jgi:hypothetical protein